MKKFDKKDRLKIDHRGINYQIVVEESLTKDDEDFVISIHVHLGVELFATLNEISGIVKDNSVEFHNEDDPLNFSDMNILSHLVDHFDIYVNKYRRFKSEQREEGQCKD